MNTQKASVRLTLPSLIDLISVPVSIIPAVNSSVRKYSKPALLFFMVIPAAM